MQRRYPKHVTVLHGDIAAYIVQFLPDMTFSAPCISTDMRDAWYAHLRRTDIADFIMSHSQSIATCAHHRLYSLCRLAHRLFPGKIHYFVGSVQSESLMYAALAAWCTDATAADFQHVLTMCPSYKMECHYPDRRGMEYYRYMKQERSRTLFNVVCMLRTTNQEYNVTPTEIRTIAAEYGGLRGMWDKLTPIMVQYLCNEDNVEGENDDEVRAAYPQGAIRNPCTRVMLRVGTRDALSDDALACAEMITHPGAARRIAGCMKHWHGMIRHGRIDVRTSQKPKAARMKMYAAIVDSMVTYGVDESLWDLTTEMSVVSHLCVDRKGEIGMIRLYEGLRDALLSDSSGLLYRIIGVFGEGPTMRARLSYVVARVPGSKEFSTALLNIPAMYLLKTRRELADNIHKRVQHALHHVDVGVWDGSDKAWETVITRTRRIPGDARPCGSVPDTSPWTLDAFHMLSYAPLRNSLTRTVAFASFGILSLTDVRHGIVSNAMCLAAGQQDSILRQHITNVKKRWCAWSSLSESGLDRIGQCVYRTVTGMEL